MAERDISMANSIILTVTGKDRPGLVDDMSAIITQQDGNWLESRITKLSGNFAGIVRVSIPDQNFDKLKAGLESIACEDFHLSIERLSNAEPGGPVRELSLEIMGPDHPGNYPRYFTRPC